MSSIFIHVQHAAHMHLISFDFFMEYRVLALLPHKPCGLKLLPMMRRDDPREKTKETNPTCIDIGYDMIYDIAIQVGCQRTPLGQSDRILLSHWIPKKFVRIQDSIWFPAFLLAARFQQINRRHREITASPNKNPSKKPEEQIQPTPAKSSSCCFEFFTYAMVRSQASEFLLAGASACGAITLTNPVDVVKTRLQLQGELRASGAAYTGQGWGGRPFMIGCSE